VHAEVLLADEVLLAGRARVYLERVDGRRGDDQPRRQLIL